MKTNYHRIATAILALLALCFFAPTAQAITVRARELNVTVQSVLPQTRTLVVVPKEDTKAREYVWAKSTQFVENNRFVDASALKEGMNAKIYYHTPFFGKPYVSKVVWLSENPASEKPTK